MNRALVQPLESRVLLSSATLDNGVLRVVGDPAAANTIDVSLVSTTDPNTQIVTNSVQVTVNGQAPRSYPAAQVSKIQVIGGKLDDTINVITKSADGKINIPAMIWGRDGNDKITAGAQNNFIWGGKGDDTIVAGNGDNRVWGGKGVNSITTGNGADWIFANAGDTVNTGTGNNHVKLKKVPGSNGKHGNGNHGNHGNGSHGNHGNGNNGRRNHGQGNGHGHGNG